MFDHYERPIDPECLRWILIHRGERAADAFADCPEWGRAFGNDIDDIERDVSAPPVGFGERDREDDWRFDKCAWYQPIHYYQENFGIYIRWHCLIRRAHRIAQALDLQGSIMSAHDVAACCVLAAGYAFLLHEFYHHKVESFATRLWICGANTHSTPSYVQYHKNVYVPLRSGNSDELIEEALANAYAYRKLAQPPYSRDLPASVVLATRKSLEAGFACQPAGYRRAAEFLRPDDFANGEFHLQQQILEGIAAPKGPDRIWRSAPGMMRSIFLVRDVPVFIVQ